MKKFFALLFSFALGIVYMSADINSTLRDAFSNYEFHSVTARYNSDFLKKFVGDTIMFDFSVQYLDCFSTEQPDTIWLKKRPKKNPELGKHYILNQAYKGIQDGDKFVTPSSAINGKPFAVYNVKSHNSESGCLMTLLDLDNLDIITLNIPASFKYDCTFTTVKSQRLINALLNKDFYYSPDAPSNYSSFSKPKFTPCKVVGGEFQFIISKSTGMYSDYKLAPNCEVRLEDEKGSYIYMHPIKASKYAMTNPVILTPAEYDSQFRCYSIDSDVDLSILNEDENFPFSFIAIFGKTKSSFTGVYQSVEPDNSYRTADAHLDTELITIGDVLNIGNTKYYKGCFNGKAFFIKASDVVIPDSYVAKLDTLIQQPQDIRDRFFKHQIALSKALYYENLQNGLNQIQSFSKFGLAIPSWSVYDVSEYTDGTGVRFSFYNPTQSIIKYVTITFQGYNAVDDPVGRAITKKCIGPIEPEETASYNFEYAWFTDIVEYAKIRYIVVQYKNGTSKTISNPKTIIFSDDLRKFFYNSNPVKDLN